MEPKIRTLESETVPSTDVVTLFHNAAKKGTKESCLALLKKEDGVLNAINPRGKTALHLAALNQHTDLCCILLKQGAQVRITDSHRLRNKKCKKDLYSYLKT